ncbi:MAG TPA: CBS domain-containing protein [Actinomycetota bacterium]|nr:CBS domain-containing protein [Actinomycetota bacterium]
MTKDPQILPASASLVEAARVMRDEDIGPVIVVENDSVVGIVTDRDIVVRGVADDRPPGSTTVGEVASGDLTTVSPDDPVDDAVRLMRERAVRRLPVVEGGKPVGIVALGDLAVERDPRSALADISAAEPNE